MVSVHHPVFRGKEKENAVGQKCLHDNPLYYVTANTVNIQLARRNTPRSFT